MSESIQKLKRIVILKRASQLAQKYCPEMLDEVVSSEEDIGKWVSRLLERLPPEDRATLEDTSWVESFINYMPESLRERLLND